MPEAAVSQSGAGTLPRARALVDGDWRDSDTIVPVLGPYGGEPVGDICVSGVQDLDAALDAAVRARGVIASMPGHKRATILRRAAALLEERTPEIARIMTLETGKAIRDSTAELKRSLDTLLLSAEEAIRIEGEHVPLDGSDMGAGKIAMLLRFPVGVVAAITPFNAPFNLTCHKLAPAIAAGNAIVLKAPPQAALTVHKAVEIFADAGLPAGVLNCVHGDAELGRALVRDPRVDFVTFTGSSRAGHDIKASSGLKRVALELGGNSPTIVHEDADVTTAAATCAINGTRLAGQSCISVQNVYVHRAVYEAFLDAIATRMRSLKVGDPLDPATEVGTLIDEPAARRVEAWVKEAVAAGAWPVTGGSRVGAQMQPTLLTDVTPAMKVVCEEVFGPVVCVIPYRDIGEVFAHINESRYGLQCGLFTRSNEVTFRAIREIRTGGVIVNGSSTWRTDQLPYGGVKASGIGREGPKYAIRELTEERLVVFNL